MKTKATPQECFAPKANPLKVAPTNQRLSPLPSSVRRACTAYAALMSMLLVSFASSYARANCAPSASIKLTGPVLTHPQVTLIFWGTSYADGTRAGRITGAIQDMVNGPYFSMLNQYNRAGMPELSPNVIIKSDSNPPVPFKTSKDVGGLVRSMQGNMAPIANNNVENLYVVILDGSAVQAGAPEDTSGSVDDVCAVKSGDTDYGCHSSGTASNGSTFYYAWVANHARLTFSKSPTSSFAHEVAEAIVDPVGGNTEIGDLCGPSCSSAVGGTSGDSTTGWYNVAGYYSALDGRCVTPRAWASLVHRRPDGGFDQTGIGPVRQAYASAGGLVMTDNNNPSNVWALPVGAVLPTQIGPAASGSVAFGSMLAVSDQTIYALAPDNSLIFEYFGSSGWFPVGIPPTNTMFSAIYAGGNDTLATETTDQVTKLFLNQNWSDQPPMSAIAVNENAAYGLNVNHTQICTLGGGTLATNTKLGYKNLFASPTLLSTISGSSVWSYSDPQGKWYNNNSTGGGFLASTSSGTGPFELFDVDQIDGTSQQISHLSNALASPAPAWDAITTGGVGKLINGGSSLYALTQACPVSATIPSPRTPTCP